METIENKDRVKLPLIGAGKVGDIDLEAEMKKFEAEQVAALGLEPGREQWRDEVPSRFTAAQRTHTTILCGGLTMAHDMFIEAGLRGLGYKVKALDVPDTNALTFGKEFGNRG